MNLDQVIKDILNPGLANLPMAMDSPKARLMLLTIGLQESRFESRYQKLNGGGKGPARGFWQFEQGGGVKGVMTHHQTGAHAHRICDERSVPWERPSVWSRLETDDILALCFARLLLYSDPYPLPDLDDHETAWKLYVGTWRPGKPHRSTWDGYHAAARNALGV
jgi:hypothetical protein